MTSIANTNSEELKNSTIKSAAFDSILQIILRIISSILNAFIVRHVSQEVFAVMFVRLHLLYDTGLLLSREAFRRAALGAKQDSKVYKIVNLVWLSTLVSIPICIGGWYIWIYVMDIPPRDVTTEYASGVTFMIVSLILEVMAEVPFILAELQLWVKTKVAIEGVTQLIRSILLAFFIFKWTDNAIFLYGLSQLAGSIFYVISYYGYFYWLLKRQTQKSSTAFSIQSYYQLFPTYTKPKKKFEIDEDLARIVWSFFKQGWLKEILTKGEWYMMNFLPIISLAQQGVYQVVNNLGSLAARLIFRSIESASYKYFAQMMERGIAIEQQEPVKMKEVSKFLSGLYRSLILLSLVIITFGWSYSYTLLQLYGGSKLSEGIGTDLMRAQCFLVVLLAINGISEAYTFATMSDSELAWHNKLMVLMSVIYIAFAYCFTNLFGAIGFIIANCTNMLLRILHSFWFIRKKYKNVEYSPLEGLRISSHLYTIFLLAFSFMIMSEKTIGGTSLVLHVFIGGTIFITILYFLRWELKPIYEKILKILEGCLIKIIICKNEEGKEFSKFKILSLIHNFLYNKVSDKTKGI